MIIMDSPGGATDRGPVSAALLPLVYDPGTARIFWLDPDRRILSSPVTADGRTSLATTASTPLAAGEQIEVAALLRDIADVTGRPLRMPVPTAPSDGREDYTVVWLYDVEDATTPRWAAEQAWLAMRRGDSHACVFQVVNRRTGTRVEVDLLDEEPGTGTDHGNPS